MISYFNIPTGASINVPITKKQFGEKVALSGVEKRALREEVERITMKALLQTRNTGIASYNDCEYNYDQIVFAEVDIRNQSKTAIITTMMQKAFPSPMFLIAHCEYAYCVNWCVKRINQSDRNRRVIEDEQTTRYFTLQCDDTIVNDWLQTLDSSKIACSTLKELFDELSNRLIMLSVSDEAGVFIENDIQRTNQHRFFLVQLAVNRDEQKKLVSAIKSETQFNIRLKLATKLKELQQEELQLKNNLF